MSHFRSCSLGLVALVTVSGALSACGADSEGPGSSRPTPTLTEGQSEFESAPPNGASNGERGGPTLSTGSGTGGTSSSGGTGGATPPAANGADTSSGSGAAGRPPGAADHNDGEGGRRGSIT